MKVQCQASPISFCFLKVFQNLDYVGLVATREGLEASVLDILKYFGNTGIRTAEEGLEKIAFESLGHLRRVGEATIERQMGDAARTSAFYLSEVGIVAAEHDEENTASFSVTNLEQFRAKAALKKLYAVAQQCELSLNDINEALCNDQGSIEGLLRQATGK